MQIELDEQAKQLIAGLQQIDLEDLKRDFSERGLMAGGSAVLKYAQEKSHFRKQEDNADLKLSAQAQEYAKLIPDFDPADFKNWYLNSVRITHQDVLEYLARTKQK